MIVFALGFVFGAWFLQQQAVLPSGYLALLLFPVLILYLKLRANQFRFSDFLTPISLFVFSALFGFGYAASFAAIRLSDELPKTWEQKSIVLIGVVATKPELTERGERFQFDVERVLTPEARVPHQLSLNFYQQIKSENTLGQITTFHAGQRWQLTVRLKRPHTTYNPHGFDFEAWALAQNIRATGNIASKSGYRKIDDFVWRPDYLVEACREKIGDRMNDVLLNKPYAGVLRALVIGDDSQIASKDWNVYLRTGTNHLMSISGLHITMLAGLAFGGIAFVWRRVPAFVLRMPTRYAATLGAMLIALIYACLAGLSVPTQRTLFMLLTFALALLLGKKIPISRALAIALLVVILIDPWAVIAPGFWLSFGAVAMIAYASVNRLGRPHWLKEGIHTQWAVTIGLLPMLILIFGQASIISPVANAFAIPLISLLVVPLAIIGALLPIDFALSASHWLMQLCMEGLGWLASSPIAIWQQAAAPAWAIILAIIGVLWSLLPRGFPQRWLGLFLMLPMLIVRPIVPLEGEMKVAVLDVGQGLSVLIQTKRHAFLYDTGPIYNQQSDAGSKIIVPYLRGEGIQKLDGMVVSHNDVDHSGGALSVLTQVPVSWLASSFDLLEPILIPKRFDCQAGQVWNWDSVHFEVLYPNLESYHDTHLTDNNRSCVVKVTSAYGTVLLTGDIEKEAEMTLLETNKDKLRSDVLIAPHHGSKTSSTEEFVTAVNAKHIIFTVGYLNRFRHPKPLIEKRFKESGAMLYRSDYRGEIELSFSKDLPIKVVNWRQAVPKYWHDQYE